MSTVAVGAARGAAASLIAVLCLVCPRTPLAQSVTAPVLVRTYNTYGVSGHELGDAAQHAARLLAEAGVPSAWRDCRTSDGPSSTSGPCDDLPLTFELIVRIVKAPASGAPDMPLGEAHMDAATGRGALATIFGNRITAVAAEAGMRRSVLLGRVLAHEVGHLLLGATAHSTDGLMRARWPVEWLRASLDGDWQFAPADAERLRLILTSRALSVDAGHTARVQPSRHLR